METILEILENDETVTCAKTCEDGSQIWEYRIIPTAPPTAAKKFSAEVLSRSDGVASDDSEADQDFAWSLGEWL